MIYDLYLINDSRLKIDKNWSRDVFSGSGLGEKGVEWVISSSNGLIWRHLTVGLDSVLKAVEFPAGIT